jgi:hypothetical protein
MDRHSGSALRFDRATTVKPNSHPLRSVEVSLNPIQTPTPNGSRALRGVPRNSRRHSKDSGNTMVKHQGMTGVGTVSKCLGHANVQITLTTYAHAIPKPRQGASDRMAALMRQDGNKVETCHFEPEKATLSEAAQLIDLAERVGFEPTNTREDVTGIPVQRLRPLGHLSNQRLIATC